VIDLRSDLLALPTDEMWEAMRAAPLGWATYGEDATVERLQDRVAELLDKERGLWVPTCGMANLVALLTYASPGDAVVLESQSHVLTSEAMAVSEVARLDVRSLWARDGRLDPAEVAELVAESRASLLVLENTHTRAGGTVLDAALTAELARAARSNGAYVHVDGARLANAAVALDVPLRELAAPVHSVAFSLTKGVGAPMGTILAGSAPIVERAHRQLRLLNGASVHRAGIPAAAALVGLDSLAERIAEDHRRARELGALLDAVPGLRLDPERVETNIVLVDVGETALAPAEVLALLEQRGVRALERDTTRIRFVTHGSIGDEDVGRAAEIVADVVARHAAGA
jgi:threonine aldolase